MRLGSAQARPTEPFQALKAVVEDENEEDSPFLPDKHDDDPQNPGTRALLSKVPRMAVWCARGCVSSGNRKHMSRDIGNTVSVMVVDVEAQVDHLGGGVGGLDPD